MLGWPGHTWLRNPISRSLELATEQDNFLVILLLHAHVLLLQLIDLVSYELGFLNLLLDLLLVAFIDTHLILELGADLIEKLIKARIMRHASMRVHGHVGGGRHGSRVQSSRCAKRRTVNFGESQHDLRRDEIRGAFLDEFKERPRLRFRISQLSSVN